MRIACLYRGALSSVDASAEESKTKAKGIRIEPTIARELAILSLDDPRPFILSS
jgi:hypothetical protein